MTKRVLLVDDSDFVLAKLRSILEVDGDLEIVGTASHGLAALEMSRSLRPDIVTLDVRMPVMDGVSCLKHLMVRRPVPVVMISAFTTAESYLTFDCLRFGAVDFVTKPRTGGNGTLETEGEEIRLRLKRAVTVKKRSIRFRRLKLKKSRESKESRNPTGLLVISAGRSGLAEILSLLNALPSALGLAVVIDLEQPQGVVESFSGYLSRFTEYRIGGREGPGILEAGEIRLLSTVDPQLLAPDGQGVALFRVPENAGGNSRRLVESLFESVVDTFGQRSIGVLLSGAEQGAVDGLAHITRSGGLAFAQDPGSASSSSVLESALSQLGASKLASPLRWATTLNEWIGEWR